VLYIFHCKINTLLCYTVVSVLVLVLLEANIIGYWILGALFGIVLTLLLILFLIILKPTHIFCLLSDASSNISTSPSNSTRETVEIILQQCIIQITYLLTVNRLATRVATQRTQLIVRCAAEQPAMQKWSEWCSVQATCHTAACSNCSGRTTIQHRA